MSAQEKRSEPVAIVGIGCRFPGASDPESFWRMLRDGVDAISEVPQDRFDINEHFDPEVQGKIRTRMGGFLDSVDRFDPYFFGVSPREAAQIDPQQRLLLEVAWEAMEDAGQLPDRLTPGRTGVYIGVHASDYNGMQMFRNAANRLNLYCVTGATYSCLSGRISHGLGLTGPSLSLDTACSSSLVATHLAVQALRAGDCERALAGGVNLIIAPELSVCFSDAKMLAPDGHCKAFDARADGFVRSDGVGVVVLKTLSRARADGDDIYALILGGAVNNDGQTSAMILPDARGHQAVLRHAYRSAGILPGQVQYVEAHGTGTSAGDPIECEGLGAVMGEGRTSDRPCLIGSVKTNIGHAEAAAGVAGLIKVALSLRHRAVPPNLYGSNINPDIPWNELGLAVQTELRPWPASDGPARAGVSSFGISGTNAHLVLEEAPRAASPRQDSTVPSDRAQLLPLSAHSPEALQGIVRSYQSMLASDDDESTSLHDVCYTASARRVHHDYRRAFVARSREGLYESLGAVLEESVDPEPVSSHPPKLVFVFSGQGSQWLGMGRTLMDQEPVFRASLDSCERAFSPYVDWSLIEELIADEARSRLDEVDVIQPTIFALQISLAALWRSWGVEPDAVVGQSMGEVAAAHVAGALSLEDAARVICERSRLVKTTSGEGGMAVVGMSLDATRRALSGFEDRVSIAVSSSPESTVLSGCTTAVKEILHDLEKKDVFCRWINVDYASHGPQMDPLQPSLVQALEPLRPRTASIPIYSTVTGEIVDGTELDAPYWYRNLRGTVLLSPVVERLLDDEHGIFLEVSPHPVLLSAIQQSLTSFGRDGAVLPSLRSDEDERSVMLESVGALYASGRPVKWTQLFPSGRRHVHLPRYAWQGERYWLEGFETGSGYSTGHAARAGSAPASGHPLLGHHVISSIHSGTHFWEGLLDAESVSYLSDHRVRDNIVVPAAAFVEMALAAAGQAFDEAPCVLEDVRFDKALMLPEEGARRVQVVIAPEAGEAVSFRILSHRLDADPDPKSWILHCTGRIRIQRPDPATEAPRLPDIQQLRSPCEDRASGDEHYEAMAERGLNYGPCFRGVEKIWRRDGEAIGRLRLPESLESEAGDYGVHPAFLDACLQAVVAALPRAGGKSVRQRVWLPVGFEKLTIFGRPGTEAWGYARLRPADPANDEGLQADVTLADPEGNVLIEVSAMQLHPLGHRAGARSEAEDWFYEIQWRPVPVEDVRSDDVGSWLILCDRTGVGGSLAAMLEAQGESCSLVTPGKSFRILAPERYEIDLRNPGDFVALIDDLLASGKPPCRGVVHLSALGAEPVERTTVASLEEDELTGCGSVLHLVQALSAAGQTEPPRLFIVTSAAQPVGLDNGSLSIAQSPLWGLSRVIANEHPELRCTAVDLGPSTTAEEIRSLFREMHSDRIEDQVVLRGEERFVGRLARCSDIGAEKTSVVSGEQPFRLESAAPGILDKLTLRSASRKQPGPGEVEIRVRAAALNFSDVMKALGIYPGLSDGPVPLGIECAGTVAAVGEGVERVRPGDAVAAIGDFCFGSYVTTPAELVCPTPSRIGFDEASTIPIAFLTAYYGLNYLARLREGERVLIHSASGGVGLAAVQLARAAGATVFATAGTEDKRNYLRSIGIEHVMDSRSLDFADEVMRVTKGEGVDVVLNSLAGEAIPKSISTLRDHGRFVEIGKRDIYQNTPLGLASLKDNIAFFVVDLDQTIRRRPALIGSLYREFMRSVENGALAPLPHKTFTVSDVAAAFRYMTKAKHIGKIVVSMQEERVTVAPPSEKSATFSADGTYLVTGGLGGLGLSIAEWMLKRGARNLVLVGRKSPDREKQQLLDSWNDNGARVVATSVDVAREGQVAGMLEEIEASLPPLKGIIHAAGILDDATLLQQDLERFRRVMAPKVSGAWNLHRLTLGRHLDFFVLFSSAAALIGSPGQANYSAANAALDALAHYRQSRGLPALSINWGPWSGVGLAAAQANRGDRLASRGFGSITPSQGVEIFGDLLRRDRSQIGVMPFDVAQWRKFQPAAARSTLLAELIAEAGAGTEADEKREDPASIRKALLAEAAGRRRRRLLEAHVREQVSQVLRIPASRIEPRKPLGVLGLDSLMGVELRTRLQTSLDLSLSSTMFLNHPSVTDLATHLAEGMGISLEATEVAAEATEAAADATEPTEEATEVATDASGNGKQKADNGRSPLSEEEALAEILGEASRLTEDQLRQMLAGRTSTTKEPQ